MEETEYFAQQPNYFWNWEDNAEVVAIPNGGTIAYREQLLDMMSALVKQGLPTFGALLLATAATSTDRQRNIDTIYALMMQRVGQDQSNEKIIRQAVEFMQKLALLPVTMLTGNNRLLLMQTLFENCHRITSLGKSKTYVEYFQKQRLTVTSHQEFSDNLFRNDFRTIGILNRRFPNTDAILKRMAGMPLVEESVAVMPEPDTSTEKDLVDQLIAHPRTFHVGSLIRTLWSGLNIPHHSVNPGIQPLGGFSGIVNKGNYDKLLSSEFAHDDLVFLSRIANNEALFIQREIPPHKHNLERIILIDVSIRSWGTPRTMAYALAIAIAGHPKTDIPCKAFAIANSFIPVQLSSVAEIIENLRHLDACMDCSKGLDLFLSSKACTKGAEIILITHAETIKSPELQTIIQNNYRLFHYWIQTLADGSIDVYRRQQNSKRHIQHLKLNLGQHWYANKKSTDAPQKKEDGMLPLLLPLPPSSTLIYYKSGQPIFALTPNKDLLMSAVAKDYRDCGWRLLGKQLPIEARELSVGQMHSGDWLLLNFEPENNRLTLFNLTQSLERSTFFTAWQNHISNRFAFYEDCFHYCEADEGKSVWKIKWGEVISISFEKESIVPDPVAFSRMQNQTNLHMVRPVRKNLLKKVSTVFVNQVKNLVFNTHELRLVNGQVIKLGTSQFISAIAYAEKITDDTFLFPDQSTVTILPSGVVILKSGNKSIPEIYVPLVLDMSLAIATHSHFTGNKFYLDSNKQQIIQEPSSFWKDHMDAFISNIIANES